LCERIRHDYDHSSAFRNATPNYGGLLGLSLLATRSFEVQ
jgi:hypothetical protein